MLIKLKFPIDIFLPVERVAMQFAPRGVYLCLHKLTKIERMTDSEILSEIIIVRYCLR